jgi:hypothetical protein
MQLSKETKCLLILNDERIYLWESKCCHDNLQNEKIYFKSD